MLLISNIAWAEPVPQSPTSPLPKANLEAVAKPQEHSNVPTPHTQEVTTPNTQEHREAPTPNISESENNNSPAIQEKTAKVDTKTEAKDSKTSSSKRPSASLFGAVLEKQADRFK